MPAREPPGPARANVRYSSVLPTPPRSRVPPHADRHLGAALTLRTHKRGGDGHRAQWRAMVDWATAGKRHVLLAVGIIVLFATVIGVLLITRPFAEFVITLVVQGLVLYIFWIAHRRSSSQRR